MFWLIITKTPLRISFFGGGTDLKEFYKNGYGAVLGTTINQYVYVNVNTRFESGIRASYSKTEIVEDSSKICHPLIREGLLKMKIKSGVEVVTIADVPGTGTGLGSSGSTMVGLVNGLSHFIEKPYDKEAIARISCDIEINKLKNPIGKQDQYFAAYGGFSYIKFNADETVLIEKLDVNSNTLSELEGNILCFYTGISRRSAQVLSDVRKKIVINEKILYEIRDQTNLARQLLKKDDLTKFGELLDFQWSLKKKLSPSISNDLIDSYYRRAIEAGAIGGKLNGAGGGGFFTLYCEKRHQERVREKLKDLKELHVSFEKNGSALVFSN